MITDSPWARGPGKRTWDWLFGPTTQYYPRGDGADGPVRVRSVTLDMDTVIEIGAMLKEWAGAEPAYSVTRTGSAYSERPIPEDELHRLPVEDRATLIVRVHRQFPGDEPPLSGSVTFHGNPTVNVGSAEVRDRIVAKLLRNPPRIKWRLVARLLPLLLPTVLIGLWAWVEAVQPMPFPGHAVGWVAFGSLFYKTARTIYRRRNATLIGPGHRIRMESRAQTIARRADEKKNLKVAFITAVITAPIAVGTTLLVTLLTRD